jgi:hypothetical protein
MLTALSADHLGTTRLYYLHVPFEETLVLLGSKVSQQAVLVNRCSSEALSWALAFATDVVQRFRMTRLPCRNAA